MTVCVRFAWTGDPAAGEAALAPMRAVAPPLIDGVAVMPYVALGMIHMDPVDPLPALEGHALLSSFPVEAAEALVAAAGPGSGLAAGRDRDPAAGWRAVATEPAVPSAFAGGTPRTACSPWASACRRWSRRWRRTRAALRTALGPWTGKGGLPNFALGVDQVRFMRVFPADVHVRLAAIAQTYDPNGILVSGRGLR